MIYAATKRIVMILSLNKYLSLPQTRKITLKPNYSCKTISYCIYENLVNS